MVNNVLIKSESQKMFRCDILGCSKIFKAKYSLKRHMKKHKVNKDWVCDKCGKHFALQQYLVEHDFTHTRQKPFKCNVDGCAETFRQRGKRSIHQTLVHGCKSGIKMRKLVSDQEGENQINDIYHEEPTEKNLVQEEE